MESFQRDRAADPRCLVIRVEGWDEVSPVSVDSVGTYFRVARASTSSSSASSAHQNNNSQQQKPNKSASSSSTPSSPSSGSPPAACARIVVAVSMEPNGRKVVTVRSALMLVNQLADPLRFAFIHTAAAHERFECVIQPGAKMFAPLRFVDATLFVRPCAQDVQPDKNAELKWSWARQPGEVANRLVGFPRTQPTNTDTTSASNSGQGQQQQQYWICVSVKRELYPEQQSLCSAWPRASHL